MNIEKYIESLLYRYNCLIIPDFGGFLMQPISAQFNPVSYEFIPPAKKLKFNAQLKSDDGLLIHYVMRAEGISFEASGVLIQHMVSSWKNKLKKGRTVILENIGLFCLNNEGSIVFTPFEKVNYAKSSFGLAPVKARYIMREERAFDMKTTAFSWKKASIISASFLVFAGIIGYVNKEQMKYQLADMLGSTTRTVIDLPHFSSNYPAIYPQSYEKDTIFQKSLVHATVKKQVNSQFEKKQAGVTKKSLQYQLIAGAFKYETNAQKKLKQLREQGFDKSKILGIFNGMNMVAYYTFEHRKKALKVLRLLRSQGKEVWLRKRKGLK